MHKTVKYIIKVGYVQVQLSQNTWSKNFVFIFLLDVFSDGEFDFSQKSLYNFRKKWDTAAQMVKNTIFQS